MPKSNPIVIRMPISRKLLFNIPPIAWYFTCSKAWKTPFKKLSRKTNTKQGFTWAYSFKENNELFFVSSVNISKLKDKVLKKGWEWIELTDEAKELVNENQKELAKNRK